MEDYDVLQALRDILRADESFFRVVRFLDGHTRNHIVAAHSRSTYLALNILNRYLDHSLTPSVVMNIPISMADASGNRFFDNVPVFPSPEQIAAATETHVGTTDTVCSICQEPVTCATRIRHCGHMFHSSCIDQWFSMNPRCPVCRHDIREPLSNSRPVTHNENHRMHADEE